MKNCIAAFAVALALNPSTHGAQVEAEGRAAGDLPNSREIALTDALREAILNAVAHKDYSSGTPIQISVYADKLWVWNPGHLPLDWTVAHLTEKHSSKPFNPDIANAFFRAGEIESWGRGVERILTACQEANCPAPEIDYTPGDFWLKFPFRSDYVAASITEPSSGKSSVKTPVKILQLLKEKPDLSLAELAVLIGKSVSAIERASAKLVKAGELRRIGPDKGGRWEVGESQKDEGKSMKTEVIRNQAGAATAKKTMKNLILNRCVLGVLGGQIQVNS